MATNPKKPEYDSIARLASSFMLMKDPDLAKRHKKKLEQQSEEQKQNVNPKEEKAPSNPDPSDTKPGMTPTT